MSENHKGDLQTYCQIRNLAPPDYQSNQVGPANDPSWLVTVRWGGNDEHTTPDPIAGPKKQAEQIASQQVLQLLQAKKEAFLEKNQRNIEAEAEIVDNQPMTVPIEIIASAVGIANHRYSQ